MEVSQLLGIEYGSSSTKRGLEEMADKVGKKTNVCENGRYSESGFI